MTRVLLDCDGVLADFCGLFLKLVNERFETDLVPSDITSYDIAESLGWSKAHAEEAYGLIGSCDDFAARLDVFPGAPEGVKALQQVGEVYVVTSPWHTQRSWSHDRTNWLWSRFGIPAHHVVHTSAKHICAGDVIVDDKTETCAKWLEHHPTGAAVQWKTPHNRRDRWNGWSTNNWDELLRIIQFVRPAGTELLP